MSRSKVSRRLRTGGAKPPLSPPLVPPVPYVTASHIVIFYGLRVNRVSDYLLRTFRDRTGRLLSSWYRGYRLAPRLLMQCIYSAHFRSLSSCIDPIITLMDMPIFGIFSMRPNIIYNYCYSCNMAFKSSTSMPQIHFFVFVRTSKLKCDN